MLNLSDAIIVALKHKNHNTINVTVWKLWNVRVNHSVDVICLDIEPTRQLTIASSERRVIVVTGFCRWGILLCCVSILSAYSFTEAEWHLYVAVNGVVIGSDNGLSSIPRHAIIWTNADPLSSEPLRTINMFLLNLNHNKGIFDQRKMHFKSSLQNFRSFFRRQSIIQCFESYWLTLSVISIVPNLTFAWHLLFCKRN